MRAVASWIRYQVKGMLYVDSWNVGLVNAPIQEFLNPEFRPQVRWLPYRRTKAFIADPFFQIAGAEPEILAEEFDYDINRGYIVRIRPAGDSMKLEKAIDEGLHLSYPYVFEHGGERYCIPECAAARGIILFRYDADQRSWKRLSVLVPDIAALDATVIQHDGRWWMFATDAEGPKDATLYIWQSEGLMGPWIPHPGNPVKTDVRSSRPAGTPFLHQGHLYRPSQNCSVRYGGSIWINRVSLLTPFEYAEEPVIHLQPFGGSRYYQAFHTLASGGDWTVIDGGYDAFHPELTVRILAHKSRKALGLGQSSALNKSSYAGSALKR